MPLTSFHPLVADWFRDTLGEPTAPQVRGWRAIREGRHTLIAAPTGSGKTLAAFLSAIDDLVKESVVRGNSALLPDEIRVLYVSPLKALSADIHKNLAEPRRGIRQLAEARGIEPPRITAAVRTGDTTSSERAAILRNPPHILVTTPESLYLLLTAERSRALLKTVRTVIVDEIHAVIGTRRGSHLALSLERLEQIADGPIQRIGLSATQKPIEQVARFLVGAAPGRPDCAIVDEGHRRQIDLAMEIPKSPLSAVMSHEVWEEYYDRLAQLIEQHTTTIVFVNTRRMAERAARHLSERIGEDKVTAHHGSLSKETRLDAEHRLKTGQLKALVATASLELGIDIGHVDLVCQVGSPHRIATLLQRVGRSGHTIAGTPKGRVLPVSRDDLVECAALLRSARRGDLDAVVMYDAPLDVLAQQITAESTAREYTEDELFTLVRGAWPYRALERKDFDAVIQMLSDGFSTRRGRRAALVHRDEVHATVRARRGSRMLALTSGGAIPEVADYRVILEPEETFIGTLNEDFAIESLAGDIFQLGNTSWQITQVTSGTVRVRDAHGAPPSMPFWLGEAPARSDELSKAVSDLRGDIDRKLSDVGRVPLSEGSGGPAVIEWLMAETGISQGAAQQLFEYMAEGRSALGVIPTQQTLVLERFFDESGGMQLVLHAPFGSRINRAWTLALRKKFCRQFNFELQAAATEDALLLSLGPQHSFPLADVFRYLHPASLRDTIVQAVLDAPLFATRWRWNATVSLAVPRNRAGKKVPPQLQRMQADDLMASAFPDAAACLDNIPGDRQIPDHPLVNQAIRDCLEEAMDIEGLSRILERIHRGELTLVSKDTPEPSAFADDVVNARPDQFVDDAPLEERRTHAVQMRRPTTIEAGGHGSLDADAIQRVIDQERPDPRDVDELHDALLGAGFLLDTEAEAALFQQLAERSRATHLLNFWIAAERIPEILAVHPGAVLDPPISAPPSRAAKTWTREDALTEILRGRLSLSGPITVDRLAASFVVAPPEAEAALLDLEAQGIVLRGNFTPGAQATEWCDRVLLARIHRYTLNRLRAEIAPVTPAEFMRFLFDWQHVATSAALTGPDGLREVIAQLDGFELSARAWEKDILPARVQGYEPSLLDMLCLTGAAGWARLSTGPTQVVGATPIALFLREHADAWLALRGDGPPEDENGVGGHLKETVGQIIEHLRTHGASFAHDLATASGITLEETHTGLAELVALGLVSSDGAAGLRRIIGPTSFTTSWTTGAHSLSHRAGADGRWFALASPRPRSGEGEIKEAGQERRKDDVETLAWTLLRRYGVVFRRVLTREASGVPWRELVGVYRRLEARGEIRGGRFVSGMSGEQFALPDAVERLRELRRSGPDDTLLTISAADPLNFTGVITPGDHIRAIAASRIVYRNGVPIAAMEGDMLKRLTEDVEPDVAASAAALAAGRRVPVVAGYVGRLG